MLEATLLKTNELVTGYGKKRIVNGVSLYIDPGEIVAVIGHNGAGKSTLLKAIFGLIPVWSGQILISGNTHHPLTPFKLTRAGISYVPQGNRVFTDMTVKENLLVGGTILVDKTRVNAAIEETLLTFPALRSKLGQRARTLSGGEKQMLSLASALMVSPRILLLDEPSLGLAPPAAKNILDIIKQISFGSNISTLIVEQKVREVFRIANRVYVLRNGSVSFTGLTSDLNNDEKLRDVYL